MMGKQGFMSEKRDWDENVRQCWVPDGLGQYNCTEQRLMQENHYFTMENQRDSKALDDSYLEKDKEFTCSNYNFPNDLSVCSQCKSFKTVLEVSKAGIPETYTKRLSMLNRSHFTIKLKQIKKEEGVVRSNKITSRLLLYYEAIPFSMEYAKEGPLSINLSHVRLEKSLRAVINELIQSNVYNELTIANCGFGQANQFKVFVPPTFVLTDRKLTLQEKQAMVNSAYLIVKYWQADLPKIMKPPVILKQAERRSTFIKSPPLTKPPSGQEARNSKGSEEEPIDVKKTIKLSKNYVKEIIERIQQEKQKKIGKMHELKKAKSMEVLVQVEVEKGRKCSNFMDKINQINRKLIDIRDNFVRKKSGNNRKIKFQPLKGQNPPGRETRNYENAQHYDEEILFDKYEEILPPAKFKLNQQYSYPPPIQPEEELNESIDTYLEEMRFEDEMPQVYPTGEMRKTTLPPHLVKDTEQQNANWNHQSAGNMMFKRFIQKNKEKYPEVFQQKENTSLSGINVGGRKKLMSEVPQGDKGSRLKKMLSMETFESHLQTNSVHLSEYSNELSNVKKRKEKQARNKQIKEKVQEILTKSKKAIQMLRSPVRTTPVS